MMTLTLKRNMSLPARQATMGFCDPRIKQIMEREGSKALELGNSIYPKIAVASLLWRLGVAIGEGKARRALSIVVETMPFPLYSKAPLSSLPSCFLTTTTFCIYHKILKEQGYLESSLTPFLSVKGKPMP
jgi:hypothetical protein